MALDTDDPVLDTGSRLALTLLAAWLFMLCAPAFGLGQLGWWPTLGATFAVYTLGRAIV